MKCTCKNGKITVQVRVLTDKGFTKEPPVKLTCPWCNGTGELTYKQEFARDAYFNEWCKCGNPSEQVNYYNDERGHGYTCADCGKIVQTG